MDETLVSAAVDFGGRAAFVYRADALKGKWVGTFDAELAREFFGGFVAAALCNLHLEVRYGENAHHIVEALFKAFARATARRGPARSARGRRAVDEGDAHRVSARPRVAVADAGSGNLRSVEKALARRRRRRRPSAPTPTPSRAPTSSSCPARARSATAWPALAGAAARCEQAVRGVDRRGKPYLGHLPRAAGAVRGQRGEPRRCRGLGIFPGRVRRFAPRAGPEDPAHGLEPDARAGRRRRRRCCPRSPTAPSSTSCTATTPTRRAPRTWR